MLKLRQRSQGRCDVCRVQTEGSQGQAFDRRNAFEKVNDEHVWIRHVTMLHAFASNVIIVSLELLCLLPCDAQRTQHRQARKRQVGVERQEQAQCL